MGQIRDSAGLVGRIVIDFDELYDKVRCLCGRVAYVEALERAVREAVKITPAGKIRLRARGGRHVLPTDGQEAAFGDAIWAMLQNGTWTTKPGEPLPALRSSKARERKLR